MFQIVTLILFFLLSIIISIYDIKTYHIPLFFSYAGLLITIILTIFFCKYELLNRLLGMVCMFLLFLLMRIITINGMGFGDIQYALYCGYMVGCPGFIYSSLLSSILGILFYFVFLRNRKKRIPFTPFMMVGTVTAMCCYKFIMDLI